MEGLFQREEMLIGSRGIETLSAARVAVFGIGGVGSFTAEALARGGIGSLTFVDDDTVKLSNCNRQLVALHSTLGKYKAEVMRERILDINPDIRCEARVLRYLPETAASVDLSCFDYVIDAVDTVTAKLELIVRCAAQSVPIISCMGTGNKLHAERLRIGELSQTRICPLARVMRRELRARGIESLKVLWSEEEPRTPLERISGEGKRQTPGSVSFVPSVAGLLIAGEVIRDLLLAGGVEI